MAIDKLQPGQFAVTRSRNIANGNPPVITFTGNEFKMKMTIEIEFIPDQFNSSPDETDILPTVGECAVFDTSVDTLNTPNPRFRFGISGDLITLSMPSTLTNGQKGNHGN
jgi:hypothetical protein